MIKKLKKMKRFCFKNKKRYERNFDIEVMSKGKMIEIVLFIIKKVINMKMNLKMMNDI